MLPPIALFAPDLDSPITGLELPFLLRLGAALVAGFAIGAERESRHKPAGISTHTFVIAGATLFTLLSTAFDRGDPARIAAQIVTGVGFLGAGIILKDGGRLQNVTTAASVWFAAAIGMTIGFGWYAIAGIATLFSVLVPRIPHIARRKEDEDR
ncbi:MAG: MgtC/SapB family protein [Myxococcales bacterium]|nr:MgtC/SapB family protein [Myxococcales bacterium]MCB9736026.1 MgtC/SapB family protein [Deltaproteobacteria bacterium]